MVAPTNCTGFFVAIARDRHVADCWSARVAHSGHLAGGGADNRPPRCPGSPACFLQRDCLDVAGRPGTDRHGGAHGASVLRMVMSDGFDAGNGGSESSVGSAYAKSIWMASAEQAGLKPLEVLDLSGVSDRFLRGRITGLQLGIPHQSHHCRCSALAVVGRGICGPAVVA